MKKIEREIIIEEMKRIFSLTNKMPKIKEWRGLNPKFSIDVLIREFGSWTNAWKAICVESELSDNKYRANIIDDLKIAFNSFSDKPHISEIIRASKHTVPTIMKYFGSVDNALKASKIDISKKLSNEELLAAFKETYDKIGKTPTAKEIKENCKYAFLTLIRRFGSIDNMMNQLNLPKEELRLSVTELDLIDDLQKIYTQINNVPTLCDIKKFGKYSPDTYQRVFGNFSNALAKVGLQVTKSKKIQTKCEYCGIVTANMIAHFSTKHKNKLQEQEEMVMNMFKSGQSCRTIAISGKTIFNGPTSIMRVVKKYLSPEEIKILRIEKIKNTLKKEYADGEFDWVNEINRNRNSTKEAKEKNSQGLKESYKDGARISWNKGLTKETDERVKEQAQSICNSMKSMFASGEIEKNIGTQNANWNENRDEVARRYRLGLNFSTEMRVQIKKRAEYKCEKCGVLQEKLEEIGQTLECDHIIPIFKGGSDDAETNAQALCPSCHKLKTMEDNK